MANGLNYLYKSVSKLIPPPKERSINIHKSLGKYSMSLFYPAVQFLLEMSSPQGWLHLAETSHFPTFCLEKSVCYFIKKFKADLLLKLLPTHIRIGFSNKVYVKRCLELSMEQE